MNIEPTKASDSDPWIAYRKSGCTCHVEDAAGFPAIVMHDKSCPVLAHRLEAVAFQDLTDEEISGARWMHLSMVKRSTFHTYATNTSVTKFYVSQSTPSGVLYLRADGRWGHNSPAWHLAAASAGEAWDRAMKECDRTINRCHCELRERQWNPLTGYCEACERKYVDTRSHETA